MKHYTTKKRNVSRRKKNTHRRKKSRKQMTRGGKVYGKGTFGIVLGNPRIPCVDETYDVVKDKNEVSKILFNDDEIDNVKNTFQLLKSSFTEDEIANLGKYFVLPTKLCDINKADMNIHKDVYNSAWRNDENLTVYNNQVISEKGTRDLSTELASISTVDETNDFLKGLSNIITGLRLIHSKDIIHGDLKLANALLVNGPTDFRIIDIDELRKVGDPANFDSSFFSYNYMYVIWPMVAAFTRFYGNVLKHINNTKDDPFNKFNHDLIKTLYMDTLDKLKNPAFKGTLLKEKNPKNVEFIEKMETTLKTYDVSEQHRLIFKYIDRYSFGIMLLELLVKYLPIINNDHTDPMVTDLVHIIELCCFFDNGLKITTDEIETLYNKYLNDHINI